MSHCLFHDSHISTVDTFNRETALKIKASFQYLTQCCSVLNVQLLAHEVRLRVIYNIYSPKIVNNLSLVAVLETFNPLAPNDVYRRRTAQLTSRRCILNIYSTNILAEYFKHAAHSLQDAVYFIMLSFLVPVIFTF